MLLDSFFTGENILFLALLFSVGRIVISIDFRRLFSSANKEADINSINSIPRSTSVLEVILPPAIEDIRTWAYDEDCILLEQDEDLVLHDIEYIHLLMEFANDDHCPKREYIFSILRYYTQIVLCHRNFEKIEAAYQNMLLYNGALNMQLQTWKRNFIYCRQLIIDPRPITEEEADEIARLLIIANPAYHNMQRLPAKRLGYIQYIVSPICYVHYFYIRPDTGEWKISRCESLSEKMLAK